MHHPLRRLGIAALPIALSGCVSVTQPRADPPPGPPPATLMLDDPWPEPLDVPLPEDPGLLTRRILQAARIGDGRTIVHTLHPKLAAVWRRRGVARGQSTVAYAAYFCGGFNDLGRIKKIKTRRGSVKAEVDVQFVRKHRDVDFKFRWHGGRWGLYEIGDYP